MAQKPFRMDKGIKVGDWTFTQTTDGDLKISSSEVFTSQKPFIVDKGFKIGTMAWYETGEDFKASEDDSGLDQRPFLADAGIQVGDWIITQNGDLDIAMGVGITVTGGLSSSTAISSGNVTAPQQDAGTTSYTIDSLDVAGFASGVQPYKPDVVTISTDGTYVFTQTGDVVHRGTMLTPYVISSTPYWTQVFEFGVDSSNISEGCHFWSTDGMFFYNIVNHSTSGNELIVQKHSVTTAWDMSTYTGSFYSENRIPYSDFTSIGADATTFTRLKYSADGEYMILFSPTTGEIVSIPVGNYEAWHTTFNGVFSDVVSYINLGVGTYTWSDITFDTTGRKCYLTATTGGISGEEWIVEYDLNPAWDLSTATFSSAFNVVDTFGEFLAEPLGCFFIDGKLYIGGYTHDGNTGHLTYIELNSVQVSEPAYTYSIAITNSSGQAVTNVNEGETYTLSVTTNAPDGSTVWFTAQEDLQSGYTDPVTIDWLLNGSQSIAETATVQNGQATKTLSINADETTESGYEKFRWVVSSGDDGAQWSGDGAGTTPWVTINDTSQTPSAPDLTQYDWTFSTSVDIGAAQDPNTGDYYLMSNYDDPTVTAQLVEGDTQTWTITTNAPDGTQVYAYQSGVFMGSYEYDEDPSGNYSEFYYQGYPYGWYTVQNGQISGTIEPIADGHAEDGEVVKFVIKDSSSWTWGQYNELATTEWIHLIDSGTSTGSSAPVGWTEPTSDQYFTGGESVFGSGSPQAQWYMPADNPVSNNSRFRIRMNENVDTDLRRNISYCLDNLEAGEYIKVGNNFGFGLTVWGNISKVETSSGSGFYDYYFDVTTSPTSAGYSGTVYIYEYTVYAR